MKNYLIETVEQQVLKSITCDCCKKEYDNIMETQEFLSWKDRAGYGNMAFGDLNYLELDLCQYCTKKLLGEYIRVTESTEL
jgi:hypothetical protein